MAARVPESTETYESLRPLLFSIAYRMVGSVSEAEDIVQEAYLRHHRAVHEGDTEVQAPKAWLSAVTTRLAIDHLPSARVRRETYVGPWLPEPLLTDPAPDPSEQAGAPRRGRAWLVGTPRGRQRPAGSGPDRCRRRRRRRLQPRRRRAGADPRRARRL